MFGSRTPLRPIDKLAALGVGADVLIRLDCQPTGVAAVAYRARDTSSDPLTRSSEVGAADPSAPLSAKVTRAESTDEFGFDWIELACDARDSADLVAELLVTAELIADLGDPLCALMSFRGPAGRLFAIVFRFDAGTFYPFIPEVEPTSGAPARDNLAELRLRDALESALPMERDLTRWGALWDAPGLR